VSLKIPVFAGPRCIEFAGPERVSRLLEARNATAVIQRKTGKVVELQLLEHGDDSRLRAHAGNDQSLTYRSESDDNPPGVWALKRLLLFDDFAPPATG
jgi:hypothetical protein